jgi:hypothetical protein
LWATFVEFIVPALPGDFTTIIGNIANSSPIADCFVPTGDRVVYCLPAGPGAE